VLNADHISAEKVWEEQLKRNHIAFPVTSNILRKFFPKRKKGVRRGIIRGLRPT
jgi:hypothetical protein